MGFQEDDTQILPVFKDHGTTTKIIPMDGPGLAGDNLPKLSAREAFSPVNLPIQCDMALAEARILAMYTPPFAAHKAVVIHDSVDYTAGDSEHAVWVVADSQMIPYWSDLHNQFTAEMAHAAALQVTELFASCSDLSE